MTAQVHRRADPLEVDCVVDELPVPDAPSFNAGGQLVPTRAGFVEYLNGAHEAYDRSSLLREHVAAINLRYAESEVAYASDKLKRLVTPKNGCVFVSASGDCREDSKAQNGETAFVSFDPAEFSRQADTHFGGAERLSREKFDSVRESIEDCLDARIRIGDLARRIDIPTTRFAKAFRNTTGVSAYQYVLERRIARATEMLTRGTESLANVAYACGFSSQAHMTTVFANKLGVTPGKYRAAARK